MADWTAPSDIETGAAEDTIFQGFVKADTNFPDIYTKLTSLRGLQYGSSGPASPNTGDIYHNSGDNLMYRWSGSAWVKMNAGEYTAGITLDQGLKDYTKNIFLVQNADGINLDVEASAAVPATIAVGGELRQNVADVQVNYSAITAGTRYVPGP
jgi:hypothetical protein